ncbi:MAG: ATP-dependent helicase [Actinomycetota bacterium]|nr:ATP-dependent helicase [Actinomycetota bacterium]
MSHRTDIATQPDIARLVAGLEPAQREAVLANAPVVCVLAGAGTGKTKVLTLRVARRVLDASAHPGHVLVCTFSRKAAEELRDRLFTLGVGREVYAGTLHRTALRLIAHHCRDRAQATPAIVADRRPLLAELLDQSPGASRLRADLNRRIRTAHTELEPVVRRSDAARLDTEIGWAKSRLVGPSGYEEAAREASRRTFLPAARVAELYARYEEERRRRRLLDLDDLVWHLGDLLEQEADFAQAIRWWHRHLFVDEMQDLSDAQYRLLRLLAGDTPDLFVVGDPNQSVYGWNGADPELLHRMTEEFAGTRVVRLETNHRCTTPVVQLASAALGRATPPPSARGDGPLPTVARFANDVEEARWVARQVWAAHRPGRRWSSIAVLARTNAQLVRIAEALGDEHVPHRSTGAELGPASDVRGAHDDPVAADLAGGDGPGPLRPALAVTDGYASRGDEEPDEAVVLSTFHRAKGLQWRTVFVVGASDGLVPLVTARSKAAKAEERRLFYVALSRAEEELTCTWALRPGAATTADDVPERRASPWLAPLEHTLHELRHGTAEVSPARAAQHLAEMRDLLSSHSPDATV